MYNGRVELDDDNQEKPYLYGSEKSFPKQHASIVNPLEGTESRES